MTDKLVHLLGGFPFLLIIKEGSRKVQLNWARIIEALIIAAIAGLLSGYIAVQKITVQVESIKEQVKLTDERLWSHIQDSGQKHERELQPNTRVHP